MKIYSTMKWTAVIGCLALALWGVRVYAETKDEQAVRAVVVKNAEAFEKGDLVLMDQIWADDEKVTVIEAGNFDYGWRNFRDKHLGPELKAMQNRKFTASDIRVHVNGKLAWATFAYKIEADFNGRHLNAAGAGAMVMEKIRGAWRIVMYSTSGKRPPAAPTQNKPEEAIRDFDLTLVALLAHFKGQWNERNFDDSPTAHHGDATAAWRV